MQDDTKSSTFALLAGDDAIDPLEDGVRRRVRYFIEAILEEELQAALGRGRYERPAEGAQGHRNGHRERQVIGTFGAETVKVPRARLIADDGRTGEWRSKALRRYQRLTKKAEALLAAVYLAGTNTRWVKRERLHEELRRRIKTQTVLPSAETVPMLFWALLASGQILMRKVDGRDTLSQPLGPETLDLAA